MEIIIKTEDGSILAEQTISEDSILQAAFTFETPDYLIEVSNNGYFYYVSNAMNGYGHNCREDFLYTLI